MVDRVRDQLRCNQDHVHDRQHAMSYQDWLLELQIQSQASHHHSLDKLEKAIRLFSEKSNEKFVSTPTKM